MTHTSAIRCRRLHAAPSSIAAIWRSEAPCAAIVRIRANTACSAGRGRAYRRRDDSRTAWGHTPCRCDAYTRANASSRSARSRTERVSRSSFNTITAPISLERRPSRMRCIPDGQDSWRSRPRQRSRQLWCDPSRRRRRATVPLARQGSRLHRLVPRSIPEHRRRPCAPQFPLLSLCDPSRFAPFRARTLRNGAVSYSLACARRYSYQPRNKQKTIPKAPRLRLTTISGCKAGNQLTG